jgi:heptosyltransferase I
MDRILIVKVTSMGDIIHGQPVVADLHRAFPGVKVDWAADGAFADILSWNPGIDRVLCAPLRRFKRARSMADLKAIAASISELRAVKYDAILDLHGVYKSAIIAFLARGRPRYGYRNENLGEVGAAFAYTRRYPPREDLLTWESLRKSVGDIFGYTINSPADFGLVVPKPVVPLAGAAHAPFAMLFHATSKDEKKWPVAHWHRVGAQLRELGVTALLPWGSEAERREGEAIAAGIPGAVVLPKLSVTEVAQHIDAAALVIGTDTGFVHLASAVGRPTVMIFTATLAYRFGVNVPGLAVSLGDSGRPAEVDEVCSAISTLLPAAGAATPPTPAAR